MREGIQDVTHTTKRSQYMEPFYDAIKVIGYDRMILYT